MSPPYGRERRSSRSRGTEGWTYGTRGKSVIWYCPPGGGEADRCKNKPEVRKYLEKRPSGGNNKQILDLCTFEVKDAPASWEKVEIKRDSDCSDCEQGRGEEGSDSSDDEGESGDGRDDGTIAGRGGSPSRSAPGRRHRTNSSWSSVRKVRYDLACVVPQTTGDASVLEYSSAHVK